MKKIIYTLLLILSSTAIFSQEHKLLFEEKSRISSERFEDTKGSPFISDQWKATIWLGGDNYISNVPINYNTKRHHWEYLRGDDYILLNSDEYRQVTLHTKKGNVLLTPILVNEKFKWVVSIYQSKTLQCYTLINCKIREEKINTPGGQITRKKFSKFDVTYIQQAGEQPQKIKRKSKSLKNILACGDQVKKIEKENKLKLKKDKDLAKLLKICEEG